MVAVSGGPDSTALLLLLHKLADEHSWALTAAHFDHGRRPGGAERQRQLRERLAPLGIPLRTGRPRRPLAASHAALRRARYAWLNGTASRLGADRIATGHQRDDQAETVLFRILRGTGNRGLSGIPLRRGRLVRPLLPFGAAELAAWVSEQGFDVFDDPSNRDPIYARNRLRHAVLPALERVTSTDHGRRVSEDLVAIGAAAERVRRANARVARRVLASFGDGTAAKWSAELRAEALRLACRREGVLIRGATARVAASRMLDLESGHGLDLGGGLRLDRVFEAWRIRRPVHCEEMGPPIEIPGPASGRAELSVGGRPRSIRWGPRRAAEPASTSVALHVDEDHYPLVVRAWRPGDRIGLPGGTRKLSRLLGEARVPATERRSVPVVVDRKGRLLCALRREIDGRIARGAAAHANFVIEVEDG